MATRNRPSERVRIQGELFMDWLGVIEQIFPMIAFFLLVSFLCFSVYLYAVLISWLRRRERHD